MKRNDVFFISILGFQIKVLEKKVYPKWIMKQTKKKIKLILTSFFQFKIYSITADNSLYSKYLFYWNKLSLFKQILSIGIA